jgi:hypothetical protein
MELTFSSKCRSTFLLVPSKAPSSTLVGSSLWAAPLLRLAHFLHWPLLLPLNLHGFSSFPPLCSLSYSFPLSTSYPPSYAFSSCPSLPSSPLHLCTSCRSPCSPPSHLLQHSPFPPSLLLHCSCRILLAGSFLLHCLTLATHVSSCSSTQALSFSWMYLILQMFWHHLPPRFCCCMTYSL